MESNEKNGIIEKIQKLLSLANSENENEAKLAAEMATKLLTRYNLSLQEVAQEDREYVVAHFASKYSRNQMEHTWIWSILQKFFFIKVVQGKRYNPMRQKYVKVWSFFGQPHNVQIAQYIFQFLDKTFVDLYDVYSKETGLKGVTIRKSFYAGLHAGIVAQLTAAKKHVEEEKGLVVVKDPGIDEFIKETVGKTKNVPSRDSYVDRRAFTDGIEKGKNIRMAIGISSQPTTSGKVLNGKT